jgi:hypothetical protein
MEAYEFPVALKSVAVIGGETVPNARCIVRTDTGAPLKVVSDKYHLFTHGQAVEKTDKFLQTFGDYKVKNYLEKGGARFVRECTFKNNSITVKTPKVNDVVHFRLNIMNSYDGCSSLRIKICAMVLRCLNGMTAPGGSLDLSFRHTSGIDILELPDPEKILGIFKRGGESWNEWAGAKLTAEERDSILHQAIETKIVGEKLLVKHRELLEPTVLTSPWDYFNNYTNVITHRLPKVQLSAKIARLDKLNGVFQRVLYGTEETVQ